MTKPSVTKRLYLTTGSKTIPADVTLSNNGLTIKIHGSQRTITLEFNRGQPSAPARRSAWNRVLSMSPADVVAYFRQSVDLAHYADDVASALDCYQPSQGGEIGPSRVALDLQAIEHLSEPSKADIAEVLTGKRTYGGSLYQRVSDAYNAYYSTTTPPNSGSEAVEVERVA